MNATIRLALISFLTLGLSAVAESDDTTPITGGAVPAELMTPPDPETAPPKADAPNACAAYATRVCFAPHEACGQQLNKLINSATKTLDIAIYHINDEKLARKIAQKAKKISVRVVADERQSKGDKSSIPGLAKAGVNIRFGKQSGIFHDQFVVVDGKRVETGSFNFTTHAFSENQENQIYTSEYAVIARYQKQFEKIWANARPWRKAPEIVIGKHKKPNAKREVASEPMESAPAPALIPKPGMAAYTNGRPPKPAEPPVQAPAPAAHAAPASAASSTTSAPAPVAPATPAPASPDVSAPPGDW